jgi:hypothetical protein
MIAKALLMCLSGVLSLGEPASDRYFREDHLTGADYIRLSADGTYTLTGREHMGVWVTESGRWEQSGDTIKFVPDDRKNEGYEGAEVAHRAHSFLAFNAEAAPSIVIPIEEIKRRLDSEPNVLPSYVFFEITKAVYDRDTKAPYPFRTRRR